MACPDCGKFHDVPTSEEEENEQPNEQNEESSSEDEGNFLPFLPFLGPPPQLFSVANVPNIFAPLFPPNPFRLLFELQRFQTHIAREQQKIKRQEERNRKRQLGSIDTALFSVKMNLNEKQCVICLEEFEEGTNLKRLCCNHHYHAGCIDKWLVQNGKCPLCNSKAVNTLEEVQSKFMEAKKLRENAHKRVERRPQYKKLKAKREEDILKNPANKLIKKDKKRRRVIPNLRRQQNIGMFPGIFGGIMFPPSGMNSFAGAADSDEEDEQIQAAIRESMKEAEEREKMENFH